jgi:hypothetical protein
VETGRVKTRRIGKVNGERLWCGPMFGEVSGLVEGGCCSGDAGSHRRNVTGGELVVVVQVHDVLDDPRWLRAERVVGEGGDPGSARFVDDGRYVAVEGLLDELFAARDAEQVVDVGEFTVDGLRV